MSLEQFYFILGIIFCPEIPDGAQVGLFGGRCFSDRTADAGNRPADAAGKSAGRE